MITVDKKFDRNKIAQTGIVPNGYSLIRDTMSMRVIKKDNVIVEGADGSQMPALRIESLLQRGNALNENTRYYDMDTVLTPAVDQIKEDIVTRSVMGEFDHPDSLRVNLDRVSHLMTSIWCDGKEVFGTAEILHKTPHGAALRGLLEHDVKVGISSRGAGQLEEQNINGTKVILVNEGFRFITWDVVAKPSVSDAIIQIAESLELTLKPIISQQSKLTSKIGRSAYEQLVVREIESFFDLR